MSGATRWQTFWRVTLALMLPVTTSAFILSFIRGVESFESAVFFGVPVGIEVITTTIYNSITQRAQPDYQSATALSFAALALMFLLLVLQSRLLRGRTFTTVTGKGYSPNIMRLGRLRWVTFGICILFFALTVALPIGQLLLSSFFKFFGFYEADMLTFDHYRSVWENSSFWRAFGNTMLLGVAGATATMTLGGIVAYVTTRTRWRGRRLIDLLAWLPWMMPGMVLGIGFLWGFAILPHGIPIYGTLWALLLAYIALGTPVAVRVRALVAADRRQQPDGRPAAAVLHQVAVAGLDAPEQRRRRRLLPCHTGDRRRPAAGERVARRERRVPARGREGRVGRPQRHPRHHRRAVPDPVGPRQNLNLDGATPSPNIWHHPATYEIENHAADPFGRIEEAMSSVASWSGTRFLDIGCGSGFHLPRGRRPRPPSSASNRTLTSLGWLCAVRASWRTSLSRGTAQALPVADASIDVMQARWAYFFGPGSEPGLAELDRVMARGGTAFVIDNDGSRSTFGSWFLRGYPMVDPDAVERFWSTRGWTRIPVDMGWSFPSRADLEAVVRIEFAPELAESIIATHDGTDVDYAVNVWWRRF